MSDALQLVELVKEATKASTTQAIATEQLLRIISDEVVQNQIAMQDQMVALTKDCQHGGTCISTLKSSYAEELLQFTTTMAQLAALIGKVNAMLSFFKILGAVLGTCTMLAGIFKLLSLYFKGP